MIFVTVGAQMPFDRLVHAVDAWACERGRTDVFAQIGESDTPPGHIEWARFLSPPEFASRVREADLIVAHAGTGSIISALRAGKPIVVLPRHSSLKETRNDHQIATAERFASTEGVYSAMDLDELTERLDESDGYAGGGGISTEASPELIDAVSGFLRSI